MSCDHCREAIGMMTDAVCGPCLSIAVLAERAKALEKFSVWLFKKHGLLIDESLLPLGQK